MLHLIRHAQSDFNEADVQLKKEVGPANYTKEIPEFVKLRLDPQWIDSGLTQFGKEQCVKTK